MLFRSMLMMRVRVARLTLTLPAAIGAHARIPLARAAKRWGGGATQRPPHASQCGSAVPWGGKGAAALTGEVQRGKGRILLERSGQLLGPLVADLAACGTRGAPAVGAASTCGKRSQAAQRNAPPHAWVRP